MIQPMTAGVAAPTAGPRRVWIVLPAYNEAAGLPRLLERIVAVRSSSGMPLHVVVVDDGSSDETAALAEGFAARLPLVLERHPRNLGLGPTLRDGLLRAVELAAPEDVVVTMDADDSHHPDQVPEMVRLLDQGHDVVIASRYRRGSRTLGVPWSRRLMSDAGSWLFRLVLPMRGVRDYTCGFRAYRAAVLRRALERWGDRFFDQDGFQAMVDVLLKLRPLGVSCAEVPMVLRYDLKQSRSKMRVARTAARTLRLLVRRRLGGA
jgi:dolichol-phosphate mannosyltransferase